MSPRIDTIKAWHRDAMAWALSIFGPIARDPRERAMRLVEEALEFGQTQGMSLADAQALVARVYSRPAGAARKEIGQVAFTLALAATNLEIPVDRMARIEFERVRAIPKETWEKRHAAKVAVGAAVSCTDRAA